MTRLTSWVVIRQVWQRLTLSHKLRTSWTWTKVAFRGPRREEPRAIKRSSFSMDRDAFGGRILDTLRARMTASQIEAARRLSSELEAKVQR